MTFTLSNTDACTWLHAQPAASINLLITDPPYESLEKHRAKGTTTRLKQSDGSSNEWFDIFPNVRFPELMQEIYRVLAKNSHFYMFCDQETMFVVKPIAEAAGFKFWKPIIWDKVNIGMGYHYRCRYEVILFFEKGKRRLKNLGVPDVLSFPRVRNGYPTEKPTDLSDVLISQSSAPGEVVADPFMGSAAFGVSALRAQRAFLGNDLKASAVQAATLRLGAAQTEQARVAGLVQWWELEVPCAVCPGCQNIPTLITSFATNGEPYYTLRCTVTTCPSRASSDKMRMTTADAVALWNRHYGQDVVDPETL